MNGKRITLPWVLTASFALACDGAMSEIEVGQEPDLSRYFISPDLCADLSGPDCRSLRLGDDYLTTAGPARGKLYACSPGNPNAPGSQTDRITWIDWSAGTWNLLSKPFLPPGAFTPEEGTLRSSESGGVRTITTNNLPVDRRIGDWPLTQYPELSAIDGNPGVPSAGSYTFSLPMNPTVSALATCTSLGAIGVTLNGVVLYNAADARGDDAVAHEIVDEFGGHPAMSDYHYHYLPERLDAAPMPDGHSGLVGYIRDGFGLYGYSGVGGDEMSNADLDECHGHEHAPLGYHYHATIEYPYTIGCYRGSPAAAALTLPAGPLATTGTTAPVVVDPMFLVSMIRHHRQALVLAALVPGRSAAPELVELAARMRISQSEEVELMRRWLPAGVLGGEDQLFGSREDVHDIPGMISDARVESLSEARGRRFDRLFLETMMEHHEGAIAMARNFLEGRGASEVTPDVAWLLRHIDAEQAMEVRRLRGMLAALADSTSSPGPRG